MSRHHMTLAAMALVAFTAALPIAVTARDLTEQSNQALGVSVRVRPIDIAANAEAWKFQISLDTHSQELADDLKSTAFLVGAAGKLQAPLSWDGAKPGGHHRAGTLHFAPVSPMPKVLELRIQRPTESAPRTFRWTMP